MEFVNKTREFLKGKKTYILVVAYLVCIVSEKVLGFDVPNFDPGPDWMDQVWTMLGIGTVRAGISAAKE